MIQDQDNTVLGVPFRYADLTNYQTGSVVSRTLISKPAGTVTLFAFAQGQSLSEHTAPFDALVDVVDGEGIVIIDGEEHILTTGQQIIMPANIPHAVRADKPFKMVLVMIRQKKDET